MKPWFEKESNVIKFPEPKAKVIQLPNVQSYPDFLTGVKDLHNRKAKGEISQDSHDKLYQDLIHRFMKKESFEKPWFLREYKNLNQAKQEIIQSVQALDLEDQENAKKNAELLDQVYSILKSSDTMSRLGGTIKNALSDEYKENELVTISELINSSKMQYKQKIDFLKNLQDDKCIAADMLKTPGNYPIGDLFYNDEKNVAVFKSLLPYGAGAKQKGKGEHALGIMSKRITVKGAGDISVDGVATELKVETTTGGGRLGEPGAVPSSEQMKTIFGKYKKIVPMLFDQQGNFQKPRLNVSVFVSMANQAKLTPSEKKKLGTDVFGSFWGQHADPIIAEFSKANADPDKVRQLHVRANFNWYKDWMANTKGEAFVNLAVLSIARKQLAVISSGDDIVNGTVRIAKQNPYLVTPQPREAFAQINLK
tara:strand:+ start:186 stop:1454 length:1269 start_codon:yes stop_codon:yes gene_type:complete